MNKDKIIYLVIAGSVAEALEALQQTPFASPEGAIPEQAGRTQVTVSYGEELVYQGISKNKAYTDSARFAIARHLPGFVGPKWKNFGLKNGLPITVTTDWPNTGKKKLVAAGFTISEEPAK